MYIKTLFAEKRRFSRFEALYYLRQEAIEKGSDIAVTTAQLAALWQWSKSQVHAFIDILKKHGEIEIVATGKTGTTIRVLGLGAQQNQQPTTMVQLVQATTTEKVITPPPTLFEALEVQKKEKAAKTEAEQAEATAFDFTKIDWSMKDKVPTLCLYDAYMQEFKAYSPKENDMQALGRIVNFIRKQLEGQLKSSGSMFNVNRDAELMKKCKGFVKALKEHTQYGGYDLDWIANRYNQIYATIQQNSQKVR